MNKKTFKFAGLALGLSMAMAGVGVVVGRALHSPDRIVTHADEPASVGWDLTQASYASANESTVKWKSSYANMTLDRYHGSLAANQHLGGAYPYTTMGKQLMVTFTPSAFYPIDSVTVVVRDYVNPFTGNQIVGWTGGAKDNCSVSNVDTTITVTPTDKTSEFSVVFSAPSDVLSVTVNYTPLPFGTLESITVDASRTRTMYSKDEALDLRGLVITARGDSGLSVELDYDAPGVSISGGDTSSHGDKTITVSFTLDEVTKTDTFMISVVGQAPYSIDECAKDTLTNPDAITGVTASYSSTNPDSAVEIPSGYSHTFTLAPSNNTSIYLKQLLLIVPLYDHDGTSYKATYSYRGVTNYLIGSEEEANPLNLDPNYPVVTLSADLLIEEPLTITVSCEGGSMSVPQYVVIYMDGPKTYLDQVSSATNLWDGQRIVFSDGTSKIAGAWTSGNNIATGAPSFTDGDICLQDSEGAAVYTVGRVNIDDTTYYTFFDGSRYLRDSGSSGNNYLTAVETLDDNCYFTVTITDGTATIRSKANEDTPYLGFQSDEDIFSCFSSGQVNPKIYAANDYSAEAVANSFEENRLLLSSYTSEEGYCKDNEHGYYAKAKVVWQAMSDDERSAVSSDGMDRLVAWAAANGDILDENMDLVSKANQIIRHENGLGSMDGNVSLILVLSSVVIAVGGGIFFVSRRRREEK